MLRGEREGGGGGASRTGPAGARWPQVLPGIRKFYFGSYKTEQLKLRRCGPLVRDDLHKVNMMTGLRTLRDLLPINGGLQLNVNAPLRFGIMFHP